MNKKSVFADRLTRRRSELKYTQETFAQKVNMSRARYANYEQSRREPDFEIVKLFAENLGVTTDYLLGQENLTISATPNAAQDKKPKDLVKFLEQTEVMFDGETYKLDEEDREKLKAALEFAFWHAKQKNKRKKT